MDQRSICVLLMALVMASCLVHYSSAGRLRNELGDEHDSGPDGGLDGLSIGELWGTHDVLEDGVSNLVDPRSPTCVKAKNESACKTCCEKTNKAHKYAIRPGLKFKWAVCTCFERVTPRK